MPDEFMFIEASPSDASAVHALYQSLVGTSGCTWSEEYPGLDDVEEDISRASLYVLKGPNGAVIAAIAAGEGGDIAGDVPWRYGRAGEMSRLGVALPFQGRGLARRMMELALAEMQRRGFESARLMTAREWLIELYKSLGFENRGLLEIYGGRFVCMEKSLMP